MRSSMMELVYLYGSKVVKDTDDSAVEGSVTAAHVAVAMGYLIHCAKVTEMLHLRLYRGLEALSQEVPIIKGKPPVFICDEVDVLTRANYSLQESFTGSELSFDEMISSSRNVLRYYVDLIRRFHSCSPNMSNVLNPKLNEVHKYLMTEFAPYATECSLTTLPTPQNVISTYMIPKSMVCLQFYTVDNGLTPFENNKVNSPRQEYLLKKRKKGEANMPMLSMFYVVKCGGAETPVAARSNSAASKKPPTSLPSELPDIGMISFEQESIRSLHNKLNNLLHAMNRHNVSTLKEHLEERPPSGKPSSKPARRAVASKTPSEASIIVPDGNVVNEIRGVRDQAVDQLVQTMFNAVSPSLPVETIEEFNKSINDVRVLLNDKHQVEALVHLYNYSAGGYMYKSDSTQDD
ncbi:hypothetical protein AKO1_009667, partial [Acrasis kona]